MELRMFVQSANMHNISTVELERHLKILTLFLKIITIKSRFDRRIDACVELTFVQSLVRRLYNR